MRTPGSSMADIASAASEAGRNARTITAPLLRDKLTRYTLIFGAVIVVFFGVFTLFAND